MLSKPRLQVSGHGNCDNRQRQQISDYHTKYIKKKHVVFLSDSFESHFLFRMSCCLGRSEIINTHTHTNALYTQASRLCITVITPQGMPGNLVKDVRNVNHLQSVLLSHWSILPPPEALHWSLVHPAVSVGLTLFSCCSPGSSSMKSKQK